MKAAIDIAPFEYQVVRSGQAGDAWYKVVGLLIAAGVPTVFWVAALMLLTSALAITMSTVALISIGVAIAAICFAGASAVMVD